MSDKTELPAGALEYDATTDVYHVRYSNAAMAPSLALVDAVSRIEDRSPTDLEPLNSVFDPESFDSMLQWDKDGDRSVQFTYEGYDVSARSYGVIRLSARDGDA